MMKLGFVYGHEQRAWQQRDNHNTYLLPIQYVAFSISLRGLWFIYATHSGVADRVVRRRLEYFHSIVSPWWRSFGSVYVLMMRDEESKQQETVLEDTVRSWTLECRSGFETQLAGAYQNGRVNDRAWSHSDFSHTRVDAVLSWLCVVWCRVRRNGRSRCCLPRANRAVHSQLRRLLFILHSTQLPLPSKIYPVYLYSTLATLTRLCSFIQHRHNHHSSPPSWLL